MRKGRKRKEKVGKGGVKDGKEGRRREGGIRTPPLDRSGYGPRRCGYNVKNT